MGIPHQGRQAHQVQQKLRIRLRAYYIQYNTCQEAEDLPMEDFAALVAKDLKAGDYSRVLLDLRNNGGG